MKLYLDDKRAKPWNYDILVMSGQEAQGYCAEHGCPSHISFDHDLGLLSINGYEFAQWLINVDLDSNQTFIPTDFTFNVHSANPVGRENIKKLLTQYLEVRKGGLQ